MLHGPTTEVGAAAADAQLARLERLHPRVIDLSLGRIQRLLAALGRPERRLPPVVHVAGTNGKGSTIAFMRAALEAQGHRVHVYTSPHLVRFNERIRLAGKTIDDATLRDVLGETERVNDGESITFFEVTTAAAFLAFADVPAEILLLETGLGGRLDATNVIDRPALTAVTPVSLDHQQFLGDDIGNIATEKAGILKPGVTAVLGPQPAAAARAITKRAREIGAPVVACEKDWHCEARDGGLEFRSNAAVRRLPLPVLEGGYQIANAGLAVACLEHLPGFKIGADALRQGLRRAQWPGRLQRLNRGPLITLAPAGAEVWLDGGHNPDAGNALAETIAGWHHDASVERPLYLVFGMVDSKDPRGYLGPFARLRPTVLSVAIPGNHASVSAAKALETARGLGMDAHALDDVGDAIAWIAKTAQTGPSPRILVCGSLYLAGAVLSENG